MRKRRRFAHVQSGGNPGNRGPVASSQLDRYFYFPGRASCSHGLKNITPIVPSVDYVVQRILKLDPKFPCHTAFCPQHGSARNQICIPRPDPFDPFFLPDGTVTGFTYDTAGNQLTRAMANGSLTFQQSFDNSGRKITEQLFSGSVSTRQYSYAYYPAGSSAVGLLQTVTTPRETITTTYDAFLRAQTISTAGSLPETNSTTAYTYDRRNLAIAINQSSMNGAAVISTLVSRAYDGYRQLRTETVTVGGVTYANITQTWDAAGRRASLNDASSTLPAPLFAWQHRADGLLSQVTANNQNYAFSYADSGLLAGRTSPFRNLSVDTRDALGRITKQTQIVSGATVLVQDLTWRTNSTLNTYTATRTGTGVWNESRAYTYDARGQVLSEGFAPAAGATNALNYKFDGTSPGLGVRLDAKIGTGAPASWETSATVNNLGQVTADNQINTAGGTAGSSVSASGVATGADHVDILVDGVAQGRANYPGGGAWSINLGLAAGAHTITANAVDSSGLYTATANSTFTVTAANPNDQSGTVTSAFDSEGNVISRTWGNGLSQSLTWNAFGRLIQVSQRDSTNNGYDWTAIYDGIGRRLQTTQQPVVNNVVSGSPTLITSIYDPLVEFLEIGVAVNGAKAWKVYGPDLNGRFGGLQGTGGLEATIVDANGATKGVINDQFGNGVASVSGGSIGWFTTRVGGYGPLPGSAAETLTDITRVAEATAWRGRRIDPTGFYNLGARYYEPNSGRFLSCDPLGHAASPSLYDFCSGDPVNTFDADGRCPDAPNSGDLSGAATPALGLVLAPLVGPSPFVEATVKSVVSTVAAELGAVLGGTAEAVVALAAIPNTTNSGEIDVLRKIEERDQNVVRAGIAIPEQLIGGTSLHRDILGLTGFSVQSAPGVSISELARGGRFPNGTISVSTVGKLMSVGALVVPSPGRGDYHSTVVVPYPLSNVQATVISAQFTMGIPNPYPYRK